MVLKPTISKLPELVIFGGPLPKYRFSAFSGTVFHANLKTGNIWPRVDELLWCLVRNVWFLVGNMWLPFRCTSHSLSAPYWPVLLVLIFFFLFFSFLKCFLFICSRSFTIRISVKKRFFWEPMLLYWTIPFSDHNACLFILYFTRLDKYKPHNRDSNYKSNLLFGPGYKDSVIKFLTPSGVPVFHCITYL